MLRAYTRLSDKHIFQVKKLNLKLLARTFGLNNAQADKAYNPKAKESHLEAIRKKRKVEDVKKLEVSEYLWFVLSWIVQISSDNIIYIKKMKPKKITRDLLN